MDKTHTKTEKIPKREAETGDTASQFVNAGIDVCLKSAASWKKEAKGAKFSTLQVKAVAKKKRNIRLTWKRVPGADSYLIYGKPNGSRKSFTKLYEGKARSFVHKNIKDRKAYKYIVFAAKGKKALAVSTAVYACHNKGIHSNAKKVTLKPKKLSLKKGKSRKLTCSFTVTRKMRKHRPIRYESQDTSIATVGPEGKVKAVGKKGQSTWIYAYAQNGVSAKIKVKIK